MSHYLNSLFVLLIEPSSFQKKIIVQQFEELGISQYETVDTGSEALSIIESDAPDLVICAMFLEDMTGKEVVLDMRENPITADIPFILISTETSFSELNPVKQAGASAVLPKPFKTSELKCAINMILDWDNPDVPEIEKIINGELKVLLVDDSLMARHLISRSLEKMGIHRIVEAENGREAIPIIQQQKFDLIITDYNMPEMDGHDLLVFIRHKSSQPEVPVMMVTTEGDESKLLAVQQEGISAIMDKPFDINGLGKLFETIFSE